MRIGIDVSQAIYKGSGVAEYTKKLVEHVVSVDKKNKYVLFFSHFRKRYSDIGFNIDDYSNIEVCEFKIPIKVLEILWNHIHIVPIEWLIGKVDIFFTSDWLEPPTVSAKKVTTIHDLSVYTHAELYNKKIVSNHRKKLHHVMRESEVILCDSLQTIQDVQRYLGIGKRRLVLVYPGIL